MNSGYRVATGVYGYDLTTMSGWKEIWEMKVPPNIKNFIRRCAQNVLLMMTDLVSKHVGVEFFALCKQHLKTLKHLFCECLQVCYLWHELSLNILPMIDEDFTTWLFRQLAGDNVELKWWRIALCWCAYRDRNDIIWNNQYWELDKTRYAGIRLFHEWHDSCHQCYC